MGQQIGDCGILVLSSDHYRDLWGIFFNEFQRRWPCCGYTVYLGSNTYSESGVENVTVILSGEDHDWSTSFQKILEQIEETYLLVLLEDLILVEDVDEETIQNEFQLMKEKHLHHIQFTNQLKGDSWCDEQHMFIDKKAPYRVNVCGFWKKQTLQNLLICGESPWNFEIMGSYRSAYMDGFVRSKKYPLKLINLVEKGQFLPASMRFLKNQSSEVLPSERPSLSGLSYVRSVLASFCFTVIAQIPWQWRVRVMNFLRKIFISY